MFSIFGKIKSYLIAGLLGLVAVLGVVARVMTGKYYKEKQKAKINEVKYEKVKEVMETDLKIDEQLEVKRKENKDEVKDTGSSSELSDPNDW